jgi:glycosyltransferase family protein
MFEVIKNWIGYLMEAYVFLITRTAGGPTVLSREKTVEKLLNDQCSMSRFGDGELALTRGWGIRFQSANAALTARLKEILRSNLESHIVCLPGLDFTRFENRPGRFWKKFYAANIFWILKLIDQNKPYYETHITRPYMDLIDKAGAGQRFTQLRKLWNDREIVVVEGKESKLGMGNDLFDNTRSIERVLAPNKNAFDVYQDILAEVTAHPKSKLILIALGPTATVLAYDLARLGYQALDLGHVDIEYEWYRMGVTRKVQVEGKHTNEAEAPTP